MKKIKSKNWSILYFTIYHIEEGSSTSLTYALRKYTLYGFVLVNSILQLHC